MAKVRPDHFERDERSKKDWVRSNEQIRIPQVLVIFDGKNLGIMSNRDALNLAKQNNLDLVEVSPNVRPPVCHITNYGKYMFERNKKKKDNSKQHQVKEKEVDFRYVIGDADLQTKVNQIRKFIEKGNKVKCVCRFKQREKAHKDQGFAVLNKVIELLGEIVTVECPPKFEGNTLMCKLDVKKEKKDL
jgi:translation initiation factor IF-3